MTRQPFSLRGATKDLEELKNTFENAETFVKSVYKEFPVEDKLFATAARVVRLFADNYFDLITAIKDSKEWKKLDGRTDPGSSIYDVFAQTPLMVFLIDYNKTLAKVLGRKYTPKQKDYETLVVFPNIIVKPKKKRDLIDISWPAHNELLKNTIAQYEKDLKHEIKKTAWTPLVRGKKRLKKRRELSIPRALGRYLKLTEKGLKDQELADLAQTLANDRKPLMLHYAEKPEDYLTMYGSGPTSCMTMHGTFSDRRWASLLKHNVHPTSFYAYHPNIKGVYIQKNGKILARTLLIKRKKDTWVFTRLYCLSSQIRETFIKCLNDANIFKANNRSSHKKCEFDIPGVFLKSYETYVCPVPYFDINFGTITINFNEKTKIFKIRCGYSATTEFTHLQNSQEGMRLATQYLIKKCVVCNYTISTDCIRVYNGNNYCSRVCLNRNGLVEAIAAYGREIAPEATAVADALAPNEYYINRQVFIRQNCGLPFSSDLNTPPEDLETCPLTRHGHKIGILTKNNLAIFYRINTAYFEYLQKTKSISYSPSLGNWIFTPSQQKIEKNLVQIKTQKVIRHFTDSSFNNVTIVSQESN